MRKLVTIRTVSELRPIEGADVIELAIIDGWQCVVKKGEFKVGDKGFYFEIDSFVPAKEPFMFLEKNFRTWNGHYGARIKTMRLRGQLSQGLLLPANLFPEINATFAWVNAMDVSDKIGVLKWEREGEADKSKQQRPNWLGRKLKKLKHTKLKPLALWLERKWPGLFLANATRPFPTFIPKTDEERVQNIIGKLDTKASQLYEVTVKLDGSSMTCYYNQRRFGVCSRNLDLKRDEENKFWSTALNYSLEKAMKKLKRNVAIQGELMGPGIQGNREKLVNYAYFVYKIWDIDLQRYMGYDEKHSYLSQLERQGCAVDTVPEIGVMNLSQFNSIDDFLAFAEGPSFNVPTREGVVFTPVETGKGFKVISNSFLLKEDN
jgi:hypothetical protein